MKIKAIIAASLVALGMQQDPLSNVVNLTLPNKSVKLKTENISSATNNSFKSFDGIKFYKNIYKVDQFLIGFGDFSKTKDESKTLEEQKNELAGIIAETKASKYILKLEIIKVNNIEYFIYGSFLGEDAEYMFTSEQKNHKAFHGMLQFKKSDQASAYLMLNNFLKGVKFKN